MIFNFYKNCGFYKTSDFLASNDMIWQLHRLEPNFDKRISLLGLGRTIFHREMSLRDLSGFKTVMKRYWGALLCRHMPIAEMGPFR